MPIPPEERRRRRLQRFMGWLHIGMHRAVEKHQVPGAVLTIVSRRGPLLFRGYGYASLRPTRRKVDPWQTRFRVASLTKIVTATAMMPLFADKKLGLHEAVSRSLPWVRKKNPYKEEITPLHLLTHTSGLGPRFLGMAARKSHEVMPLARYLPSMLPSVVTKPGEIFTYSNHGYSLLGLLIEKHAKRSYRDHIEKTIFTPIHMKHSGFAWPPKGKAKEHMAQGFVTASKGKTVLSVQPDSIHIFPAAGMYTSGVDMARFLRVHLNLGRSRGRYVWPQAWIARMQKRQFGHHDSLTGVGFAWFERHYRGIRILEHAGEWHGFSSYAAILPEKGLAVFAAFNTNKSHVLRQIMESGWRGLSTEQQLSAKPIPTHPLPSLAKFEGTYRSTRYARSTMLKLILLEDQVKITAMPNNIIRLHFVGQAEGKDRFWKPIGPLLFQDTQNDDTLAFRKESSGGISYLFLSTSPPSALRKLAWYETRSFQLPLIGAFLFFFVMACLAWFGDDLLRRVRKEPDWTTREFRQARMLMILLCALNLAYLLTLGLHLSLEMWELAYGFSTFVRFLLGIPLLSAALSLALPWFCFRLWKDAKLRLSEKLYYTILTVVVIAFGCFLWQWNLLVPVGWQLGG